MTEQTNPIEVHESPLPDQLTSAGRTVVLALGAWAVGRGWLEADTASAIGTVLAVVIPFVYGQLKIRKRATQLATIAASPKVPNTVAKIKE